MAELTGKHVLLITVGAFSVIIAVNLNLAIQAVSTHPGRAVNNSFGASQGFDAGRAAQEALGWQLTPSYADGRIDLAFTDRDGYPMRVEALEVVVGRTTTDAHDARPEFTNTGDVYSAQLDLTHGRWMVLVTALTPDGRLFERRSVFFVQGG